MNPNALPVELRRYPQWVCWKEKVRDGRYTKVPVNPSRGSTASTSDSGTWGTSEQALSWARRPEIDGIGFVFTAGDPYVGIDLDYCRDVETGSLTDDAVAIVMWLQTYTEVSPSKTGLHLIAKGLLPAGRRRRGSVEMYEEGRFFTMTGRHLHGTPSGVGHRPSAIRAVHRNYVADDAADATVDGADERANHAMQFTVNLDDDELIEKASTAANGEKFAALWNGETSDYDSHSEADMALCCLLAFWTNGDASRVDSLFRQSGLMRPKWDEVHYADGATYGERTVERACARVSVHYSAE